MLAIAAVGAWYAYNARAASTASGLIAEAGHLLEEGEDGQAFRVLRQAEPYLQGRPELLRVRDELFLPISITTGPRGADVQVKPYDDVEGPWELLGRTPLDARRTLGFYRLRVTRAGFTTFEGSAQLSLGGVRIALEPDGSVPEGMVAIPAGLVQVGPGETVRLPAFLLDRFEVTNRQFKRFVDERGTIGNIRAVSRSVSRLA